MINIIIVIIIIIQEITMVITTLNSLWSNIREEEERQNNWINHISINQISIYRIGKHYANMNDDDEITWIKIAQQWKKKINILLAFKGEGQDFRKFLAKLLPMPPETTIKSAGN